MIYIFEQLNLELKIVNYVQSSTSILIFFKPLSKNQHENQIMKQFLASPIEILAHSPPVY